MAGTQALPPPSPRKVLSYQETAGTRKTKDQFNLLLPSFTPETTPY